MLAAPPGHARRQVLSGQGPGEPVRLRRGRHKEDDGGAGLSLFIVQGAKGQAGDVLYGMSDPPGVGAHAVDDPVHLPELRQTHGGREFAHPEVDADDKGTVPGNQ